MWEALVYDGALYGGNAPQCISVPDPITPTHLTVGGWFRPTQQRNLAQELIVQDGSYRLSIVPNSMEVNLDVTQARLAGQQQPQAIRSINSRNSLLLTSGTT